jgi:hypothetical protein
MTLSDLERETLKRHREAVEAMDEPLPSGGRFQ